MASRSGPSHGSARSLHGVAGARQRPQRAQASVAAAELEATRPVAIVATEPDQIRKAVQRFDYDRAAGLALGGTIDDVTDQLTRAAFDDRSGAFIVVAHLIKTALAAGQEAAATGSMLPLAGAARFIAAPRIERFIAAAVHESIDFVTTGRPPRR
jgi:hypothetical protein